MFYYNKWYIYKKIIFRLKQTQFFTPIFTRKTSIKLTIKKTVMLCFLEQLVNLSLILFYFEAFFLVNRKTKKLIGKNLNSYLLCFSSSD